MEGFQFRVDDATISTVSGGASQDAGFTVSSNPEIVLGFSFTNATIPLGCGTLTEITLDGNVSSLSGIVVSDTSDKFN